MDQGKFHCFGCHQSGDVIDLFQQIKGLDRKGAIAQMAKELGIQNGSQGYKPGPEEIRLKRYIDSYEAVTKVYEGAFQQSAESKKYMADRGVSETTLQTFRIGAGLHNPQPVIKSLETIGVKSQEAINFCALAKSPKSGKLYDPFFGRVVFPIMSVKGHTIAFGGRTIIPNETNAKYKNTGETPFFQKGETFFGLYQAQGKIRKMGKVNLVEGYMDTLLMHQNGFENTVSTMGTAVTKRQMELLSHFCNRIVVIMDGDSAGQAATLRTIEFALYADLVVKVAILPDNHDPDSFLREYGADKMRELIGNAQDGLTFFLLHLEKKSINELASWTKNFLSSREELFKRVVWAKLIGQYFMVPAASVLESFGLLPWPAGQFSKPESELDTDAALTARLLH